MNFWAFLASCFPLKLPGEEDVFSRLVDFVEDEKNDLPEAIFVIGSLCDEVKAVLATLSQKESEILQYRFGLN